jgi:geranylgeranyl reductase family protein
MMDVANTKNVIIVGGGPAGSTAGYLLKKKYNIDVLLIEKNCFPREKLCGGLITDKTVKLLEELYKEPVTELVKNGVINYQTNKYKVFYRNYLLHDGMTEEPFFFVNRSIYDLFLLEKAKKVGVAVIEGKPVKTYDSINNRVFLDKNQSFRTKYLIGADGVNSVIRTQLLKNNFDKNKWKKNLSTAFEIFIDRSIELEDYNYPVIYFGYLKFGYCWIFPNTDRIICGIGGLNVKNHEIAANFKSFLSNFAFKEKNVSHIKSALIPTGGFYHIPAAGNVALIGDAGGFVNPFTGEGIYYAHKSGEIVAEAVNESLNNAKCFRETYLQLLKARIVPEFNRAKKVRNVFYRLTNTVFYLPMKILLQRTDRKIDQFMHGVQ